MYVLAAVLVLVSLFGFWAGRPATPAAMPALASNARVDEVVEIKLETDRLVAEWEDQVSELKARISETSGSQETVSNELRLARELREAAEKKLHDCKAYGPEFC